MSKRKGDDGDLNQDTGREIGREIPRDIGREIPPDFGLVDMADTELYDDNEPDYTPYMTMKNIREYCIKNNINIRISLEEVVQLLL